jgi:PAS domain S-box-containing protein
MHDGSLRMPEGVVRYYNRGEPHSGLYPRLRPLGLRDSDVAARGRPVTERRSQLASYAIAVACALVAVLARIALTPLWDLKHPLLTFYPAVAVAAWFGGFGPGLLTTLLCAVAGIYLLLPPPYAFVGKNPSELVGVGLFVFIGMLFGLLSETLHRRQRYVSTLLESISDGFVAFDRDWRYTFVNARAAELLRHRPEELLGRRAWDVFPDLVGSTFELEARRAVTEQIPRKLEFFYAPYGLWTEIRMFPSKAGLAVYIQDIADRRRGEEALNRLAAIVRFSDDAIVSKTLDGTITSWNPAAERMFGYTASEAVGQSITIIIPPERLGEEDTVLDRIRRGDMVDHFETVRVRKDGTLIDISLTVSPVKGADGQIIGASKSARDISDRKNLERQRAALLASEQAARAAAEAANRSKDEFLAMLSHELRTPLASALGWARILQTQRLDEVKLQRAVGAIGRSLDLQLRLVNDLLDVSGLAAGKVQLERRDVDLAQVVRREVEAFRAMAAAGALELVSSIDGPLPIVADPSRIQQIVGNLVSNAIKFTPPGGRIEVDVRRVDSRARIVVSDTGRGIEPEFLPLVFEKFRQAEASTTRQAGGLGLGLAIVRSLVELHFGTVRADSAGSGKGATFTVSLPLAPDGAEEVSA